MRLLRGKAKEGRGKRKGNENKIEGNKQIKQVINKNKDMRGKLKCEQLS